MRRLSFQYARAKIVDETARGELAARDVTEAESLAIRGDFHLARRRLQAARPLLERAVELAPDLAAAHASLGLLALREDKPDEARRRVARAVELDSKSFLIHYLHAILNMGGDETRESLAPVEQSLQRSVALNPDFAPAYALLAEVTAYRSGDYAGAVPLAQRAISLEPGVIGHRLSLGRLFAGMGKLEEAGAEGGRALAAARSDPEREAAQQFLDSLKKPSPPPASPAAGDSVIDGSADRPGALSTVARGTILSMSCPKGGDLLFVVETAAGRLTLRADAPDSVLIHKGGAWVQMDWTCGALRIPATVAYVPRRPRAGAPRIDGTVLAFDLDAVR